MAIDWDHISEARFDEIVEALVARLYPGADVQAHDGRGGDGGRDIEVIRGRQRRVYQLKCFPEGFSGGFRNRRNQITKSMDAVMGDPPNVWILAVPCKLTPQERAYVQQQADKRGLTLGKFVDRTFLNSSLARHPDLVSYFNRGPELRRDAVIYNQEKAALLGGAEDVSDRVRALGELADAQDPHWGLNFSREGEITTVTVTPKTPHASALSPVTTHLELEFGPEHSELQAQLKRSLSFGLTDPVVLPPAVVRRFKVDGPEMLQRDEAGVHVELRPEAGEQRNHTVELRFIGDRGAVRSSYTAESTLAGKGSAGWTLRVQMTPALQMTFLMPSKADDPGDLDFTLDPDGASASDVREVTDLLRDLHQGGDLELRIGADRLALMRLGEHRDLERLAKIEAMALFADDLDVVGRYTRQRIPYSDTISNRDRVLLRALRLAIDGYCALTPFPGGHRGQLVGDNLTEVRPAIETPQAVVHQADVTLELLGRDLPIDGYTIFHPRLQVDDKDDLLRAIDTGTAAGREVRFRPPPGEWFHMFIQSRPAPDYRLEVTPWGIPGLEDLEARAAGQTDASETS